jgi:pyrroline-5-carboxylate reductase
VIDAKHDSSVTPVFLGGGRITSALAAGLRLAGYTEKIVVYDRNPEKLKALRRESRIEIAPDVASAVWHAGMIIVAVRPASVVAMLEEVAACAVPTPKLCVSLAAGIPLRVLHAALPSVHWARAMPSPVCRIARGLTALCFERGVTKSERAAVRDFFAHVGAVVEIPERQFDAFTATFSASHGYHALATLSKAAQRAGLDRAIALTAASHALCDGIGYWRDSGADLEDLLQEAATPGGTAAATITAMDRAGYARAVTDGLRAGIGRARQNAKH